MALMALEDRGQDSCHHGHSSTVSSDEQAKLFCPGHPDHFL
jgi:hypothetical protein